MEVLEREVEVQTPTGIHARAAVLICQLASKFSAEVELAKVGENNFINAKSILSVMSLGSPCGSRLLLRTYGKDSREALEELARLLEDVNLGTPVNNNSQK